jgi:hypothetical protein
MRAAIDSWLGHDLGEARPAFHAVRGAADENAAPRVRPLDIAHFTVSGRETASRLVPSSVPPSVQNYTPGDAATNRSFQDSLDTHPEAAATCGTVVAEARPAARVTSLSDIMMRFQSLGDNCEFGLLQRWSGAEPLDLLRFAGLNIPVELRLRRLIDALGVGFRGLGDDPSSVRCELQGEDLPRPYMVRETLWDLSYHIDQDEHTIGAAEVHGQQVAALRFRRRKLLEDLREAHRVFVWKSNAPSSESEIGQLVEGLRRHGPNLLLWVALADDERHAGHVEYRGDGLLKGYVSRFAPYDEATNIDTGPWYDVCCNAWAAAEVLRQHRKWGHVAPP